VIQQKNYVQSKNGLNITLFDLKYYKANFKSPGSVIQTKVRMSTGIVWACREESNS